MGSWHHHFEGSDLAWEDDPSGSLKYLTDEGERYSLIMEYQRGIGLSLAFSRYNPDDRSQNFHLIAQPRPNLGPDFVLLDNGASAPTGSFMPLRAAWPVVQEFLKTPTTVPKCISWLDARELDWPDV